VDQVETLKMIASFLLGMVCSFLAILYSPHDYTDKN